MAYAFGSKVGFGFRHGDLGLRDSGALRGKTGAAETLKPPGGRN